MESKGKRVRGKEKYITRATKKEKKRKGKLKLNRVLLVIIPIILIGTALAKYTRRKN